jgi:hypothetical protein
MTLAGATYETEPVQHMHRPDVPTVQSAFLRGRTVDCPVCVLSPEHETLSNPGSTDVSDWNACTDWTYRRLSSLRSFAGARNVVKS